MRKLLGALAVVALALMVSAPAAEAHRCWWNGYRWVCKHHTRHYVKQWNPHRAYAYYPQRHYYPAYYRPHYRTYYRPRPYAYACVPPFCW